MNDTFEEADEGGLGAGGIGVAELPRVDADTEATPPGEEVAPSDSAGVDVDADVEDDADRQVDRTVGESSVRLAAIAVVIVLVGAAAGLIGSFFIPKEYAARAEITYHLMESQPNELLREDRRLTTQLVLLGSRVVLAAVAEKHAMAPEDLVDNVSAEVVDNSEIIQVEVRAGSPDTARTLLTDVVGQYLALANNGWNNPVREYLEFQLAEVQTRRRAPDLPPEVSLDLARREAVITSLTEPFRRNTAGGPQPELQPPARLLTKPYAVLDPVSPKPLIATGAGAAAASIVAALIVLLIARRRSRL